MRAPFEKLENDTYLPHRAPRHGFDGYLDVTIWDGTQYTASKHAVDILQAMVAEIPRIRISWPSLSRLILTTLTNSLPTKALFSTMGATPRVIDVKLLEGNRVYKGDPGRFTQWRGCSGHHVRLPHGSAPPICTRGVMAGPCYDPWLQGGDSNTHAGPNTISSMLKSNHTVDNELDLHAFSSPFAFPGFWPTTLKQTWTDPPNSWGIMAVKIYPQNENGTDTVRSADPTDTPQIYFRRFTQGADVNVPTMKEMITWGRCTLLIR
ncbi:hypothetical protein DL767_001758 [Monosporascus sp. MG133]|nr:hypothetical protein DL767_001758 [Monosporascus sp. MG133]